MRIQSPSNYRAKELLSDFQHKIAATVRAGERDGFDTDGSYQRGYSHNSEQLLARFSASVVNEVQVDPQSKQVLNFKDETKGGRRSYLYGDDLHLRRHTMKTDGTDKVYAMTLKTFAPDTCKSFTETVRVSEDGQVQYSRKDHLDGKMERFFRSNPNVRMLGAQLMGAALGGSVGTLVAAHMGMPVDLGAAAGACVTACLAGGMAHRRPTYSDRGLANWAAIVPAQLIQFSTSLGTLGLAAACLLT